MGPTEVGSNLRLNRPTSAKTGGSQWPLGVREAESMRLAAS
jgi:hypothetical protein